MHFYVKFVFLNYENEAGWILKGFNFTELPLLLFLWSAKKNKSCDILLSGFLRFPGYSSIPLNWTSLLSLPCSIFIPSPAISPRCRALAYKAVLAGQFLEFKGPAPLIPPLQTLCTYQVLDGQRALTFSCFSQIGPSSVSAPVGYSGLSCSQIQSETTLLLLFVSHRDDHLMQILCLLVFCPHLFAFWDSLDLVSWFCCKCCLWIFDFAI